MWPPDCPARAGLPAQLAALPEEGRVPGSVAYAGGNFLGFEDLSACLYADYKVADDGRVPPVRDEAQRERFCATKAASGPSRSTRVRTLYSRAGSLQRRGGFAGRRGTAARRIGLGAGRTGGRSAGVPAEQTIRAEVNMDQARIDRLIDRPEDLVPGLRFLCRRLFGRHRQLAGGVPGPALPGPGPLPGGGRRFGQPEAAGPGAGPPSSPSSTTSRWKSFPPARWTTPTIWATPRTAASTARASCSPSSKRCGSGSGSP